MKINLATAALLIKLCTIPAFTEIPSYTFGGGQNCDGNFCPLSGSSSCWSSPPDFSTPSDYTFQSEVVSFPSSSSFCETYPFTMSVNSLTNPKDIALFEFGGAPNGTVSLRFETPEEGVPFLVQGCFWLQSLSGKATHFPAFFMHLEDPNDLSIEGRLVFESSRIDATSPIYFSGDNIKLNNKSSMPIMYKRLPILGLTQPIVFQSNATLTFELSQDYLNEATPSALYFQSGAGYNDENTCNATLFCGGLENYTCNIFLDNNNSSLGVNVNIDSLNKPASNKAIAWFPNAVGSHASIFPTSVDNCCTSSTNLTPEYGFLVGAISLFDQGFNKGSLQITDENSSPYHASWSDMSPASYSALKSDLRRPGTDNLTGPGYTTFEPGSTNNEVTYGVNGVFGLWIDVTNKHQTQAHLMGTNSPHFTATMLNTTHKCMQMQQQAQQSYDFGWFSLVSNHSSDDNLNEIAAQDSFIAQQSMVQQLAERNLKTPIKPWSVYVEPRGSWGQVFKQNKHHGNTFQTAGTRAGFDYLWNNANNNLPICVGLGFVADYLHTWGQRKNHSGNFSANEGLGNIYLAFVPKKIPELSINLIGGGGYSWYTFHRDLFEDSSVVATGKSSGPEADLFVELEYVFRHKRFSVLPKDFKIVPIGALQYTYTKINSYKEKGAGRYNLKVDAQDASTLSTLLGFRTNYEFKTKSEIAVTPELSVLWQYQYLDPSITSTSSYILSGIGPDVLTASLPGLPRNTLVVGADLKVEIYDCAQVQLDYDFFYNSGFITNVFFLNIKGKF